MKQFDIERFGALARWTLTMDRRFFVKTVLGYLVMLTLMFLFFTWMVNFDNHRDGLMPYQTCTLMVMAASLAITVMGPSQMFVSMKGKYDNQVLMMLPASNLEKYVMRYSYWLLVLPCFLATFVVADLLQYALNLLAGHEWSALVMQHLTDGVSRWFAAANLSIPYFQVYVVVFLLWLHSVYAIGATFFRSHKYNWMFTSATLFCCSVLLFWAVSEIGGTAFAYHIGRHIKDFLLFKVSAGWLCLLWNGFVLCLVVLNFRLSYWLFCRTQVKGRFINN